VFKMREWTVSEAQNWISNHSEGLKRLSALDYLRKYAPKPKPTLFDRIRALFKGVMA
jgi:hypothetical protein